MTRSLFARRLAFAASPLALGLALIASPAAAQDATANNPAVPSPIPPQPTADQSKDEAEAAAVQTVTEPAADEIVVTGIRASIRNAVNQKRNNSSIVEVIAAEDIGKLPDASIGEALSRLPGLTTQRFDGRANKLSVRGLAPDFTTTTLNGREMVSSDSNRAVEFDQFPSELLNGAVVYKTPDAALTNQAIGGTVDLLTIRPLSQRQRSIVIGIRGELNDNGKLNRDTIDKGYRFNIAYVDQNDAGTVGVALGYARMVQPIQEQFVHVWGYFDPSEIAGNALFPEGIKPYVKSNELTRDGFMGTLEFKPLDNWRTRIDVFYSKFVDEQTLRGQEVAGYTSSGRTAVTTEAGLITSGRWTGIRTQSRNDYTDRDVKTFAFGFNTVADLTDRLTLEIDGSHSRAKRAYEAVETYTSSGRGQTGPADNITYTLGGNGGLTLNGGLNYADPNLWRLGDNLGWGGPFCTEALGWQCASQDGYVNAEKSDDDLTALKVAAAQEVGGFIPTIRVGARYAERNKSRSKVADWLSLKAYPALLPIPANLLIEPTSLGFVGLGNTISYDPRALVASGVYNQIANPGDAIKAATGGWSVNEKVFNGYVMADLEADLGGMRLTGNVGVQAVHTDQSSEGVAATNRNGAIILQNVIGGDKYWDYLPSLNLTLDVADNHKVRLGVAKVLSRARMDDMNASREFSFTDANVLSNDIFRSPWGGSGGNPKLRPWEAWQFDASYEFYFGKGGYIAVAPFYKKLLNYIFNRQTLIDFTGVVAPSPIQPTLRQGFLNAPDNGDGGKIYGIEFSTSVPFGTFLPALEGFGALASASITRSEVRRTPTSEPERLSGLSRNVVNGTLF